MAAKQLHTKRGTKKHQQIFYPRDTMPGSGSGSAQYPQSRFKRVLKSKTDMPIANDNTDTMVYLIYMDYLSKLLEEARQEGMTERVLEEKHEELMKYYRG